MKKLTIIFKDRSKVVYTIKRDYIDYKTYFYRHSKEDIKSAILQEYPKKYNKPIVLV